MKGFKINSLLTFISIIAITSVQAATYEARYKLEELKDAVNEEAPLPSIANITFNPNIINEGESTSASWNVEGASYYYISGNNAPTSKITNNNIGIKPNAVGNLSYELEAYNFQNKSTTGFGLLEVVAKPKLLTFTSDKDTVYEGQSVVLSWTGNDVFNYKLNTQNISGNSISLSPSKIGSNTYTLYAYNKLGYEVAMEKSINVVAEIWTDTTPVYTDIVITNALYNCVNWTPNPATITTNTTFTQTATCSTDQTRNRQNKEIGTYTGVVRDKGAPFAEPTTISQPASRAYGVTLSGWTGNTVSSCTTWTPDPSTVNSGTQFTQTGSNCSLPQTRTRTENYIDHKTGANIQVSVVPQNQTVTVNGTGYVNGTRVATGTKASAPVCQYSYQDPRSIVWDITGDAIYIFWNGAFIDFLPTVSSSINSGGYRYYAGAKGPDWGAYTVCRVAL